MLAGAGALYAGCCRRIPALLAGATSSEVGCRRYCRHRRIYKNSVNLYEILHAMMITEICTFQKWILLPGSSQ